MTSRPGASHRRNVVHPHRFETLGVLLVDREPCLTLAYEDASKQTGRRFLVLSTTELRDWPAPPSWAMAVILCPGNDTTAIKQWMRRTSSNVGRVSFYYHAETDYRTALHAWNKEGLPITNIRRVTHWRDLSSNFGAHLNSVAHDDFCHDASCAFREMR